MMQRLTATATTLPAAAHGEGPRWDADRAELLWVDISGGSLRRATGAGR